MKKLTIRCLILSLIGLLLSGVEAGQQNYPVDLEYAKSQEALAIEKNKRCSDIKKNLKRWRCNSSVETEYTEAGLIRGTKEYVEKIYFPLGDKDLVSKYLQLEKQKSRSRTSSALNESWAGEVFKSDFDAEQRMIKEELFRIWKKAGKDPYTEWERKAASSGE